MKHVILISGKDSLATAIVQTARAPTLDYEFLFNDVGAELPEVYTWLDKVERVMGWEITRLRYNLPNLIKIYDFLPSSQARYCTKMAKIQPTERHYQNEDTVYAYYGLRADENRAGMRQSDVIVPVYPLVEEGFGLKEVWQLLASLDLLPPAFFWPSLYYRILERVGESIINDLESYEQRMLFAGRSRANCSFCFYQRQYEWVWLLETHPDLFWRAAWMERFIGGTGYTWQRGYYLSDKIISERDAVLNRRVAEVCKYLREKFNAPLIADAFLFDSQIAATSCGLLCGK